MLTLYTARYSNRTLVGHPAAKVGITRGHPRFRLELAGRVKDLAPTRDEWDLMRPAFERAHTEGGSTHGCPWRTV